jgi:hypothetical protein
VLQKQTQNGVGLAKKSQPENRPAPINPITMKTVAKVTNCLKKESSAEPFCCEVAIRNFYKKRKPV